MINIIQYEATPASLHASSQKIVGVTSLVQAHQLVDRQGQNAEHEVRHDLGGTPDAEGVAAELILEPGIAPLGHGALVVADGVGRLEFLLFAATRIVVNQRNMIQAAAVLMQFDAAIGGIHHVVKAGDALGAHQRQGNGSTAIVHRGRRQQCRNRHTTIGCVEMQLVAIPTDFVASRVPQLSIKNCLF